MPAKKILAVIVCQFKKKKNCNPYFIVIMITVLIMNVIFLGGKFQNSKLCCHFYYVHRTFTSGYLSVF
jgi:hypothetical protein